MPEDAVPAVFTNSLQEAQVVGAVNLFRVRPDWTETTQAIIRNCIQRQ
ncbi:hypothetical protein ACFLXY_05080 [Chloroflexota bacterium]